MNLEKSNEKNNLTRKFSMENTEVPRKTSFSQTPQPSLKNVNNDMVRIIEEEISLIADSNKELKKNKIYIFGVSLFLLITFKIFNIL